MKQLTDRTMLHAAEQRLSAHLETRAATKAEAAEIRRSFIETAEKLEKKSGDVVYQAKTAAEIGPGPHAVAAQHAEGIVHAQSLQESERLYNLASMERMRADAWICDGDDMAETWESTRRELLARVTHYRQLVDAK